MANWVSSAPRIDLFEIALVFRAFYMQFQCQISGLEFFTSLLDIRRLEWQANYFASCLLLPRQEVIFETRALAKQRNIFDRGFGLIYADEQPENLSNYYFITNNLMVKYGISRRAITLRLQEIGLLQYAVTKPKSIGSAIESLWK